MTGPGEPGRGYLFLIVHGNPALEGTAIMVRLDLSDDETEHSLQTLRFKRKAVLGGRSHRLRAVCRNSSDGSAQLAMLVDEKIVIKARDQVAMGPLRASLAAVIATAPDSDVALDNVSVDSGSSAD